MRIGTSRSHPRGSTKSPRNLSTPWTTSRYPSARRQRSWPPSAQRRARLRPVPSRGRSTGAAGAEPGVIRTAKSIPRHCQTGSGDGYVNEPQVNVDHYYHRPVYNVVGLLTEKSEMPTISSELESTGVDVAAVKILCGEQGARILNAHGRYHGLRARIVRAFQQLGYAGNTLAIYDEVLGHGELVLHVPAPPADRSRIAALLQRHHVHDVGYFGPGTFEQFSP